MSKDGLQPLEGMPITPEPGWVLRTPHGVARCGEEPDDYLVRLADVVRWFHVERGVPIGVAVERVVGGITPENFQHMYYLHEQVWAQPMWEPSPWDEFAMTTEEQALPYLEGRVLGCIRGMRAAWLMTAWDVDKFFNSGRPAGEPPEYVKELESPFEFMDRQGSGASSFAIRMSAAHELWGWGSVAAAVAQPDVLPSATARPTTVQELEALLTDRVHAVQVVLQEKERSRLAPQKWSFDLRRVVDAKLNVLMADGKGLGRSDACEWVGVCLGVSRSAIVQQMTALGHDKDKQLAELAKKSDPFNRNKAA